MGSELCQEVQKEEFFKKLWYILV